MLRKEIRNTVGSLPFALGALALAVGGLAGVWEDSWQFIKNPNIKYMDILSIAHSIDFAGVLFYLVPVVSVLPFAVRVADELNGPYRTMLLARCGMKRYIASRLILTAATGALIVGLGIACMNVLVLIIFPKNVHEFSLEGIVTAVLYPVIRGATLTQTALRYMLFYTLMSAAYGMVMALLGLVLAVLAPNRYVALIGPLVIVRVLAYLMWWTPFFYLSPLHMQFPMQPSNVDPLPMWMIPAWYVGVTAILCALGAWGMKRRLRGV